MGAAAVGYCVFLAQALLMAPTWITEFSFTLVFYGLYFGILSRDIIEYGASRMASTIGVWDLTR